MTEQTSSNSAFLARNRSLWEVTIGRIELSDEDGDENGPGEALVFSCIRQNQ